MEDEVPLTFGERALEFAIAVPDTFPFQFVTGLVVSLVIFGLLALPKSNKPKERGTRKGSASSKRVKLSAAELRAVRAQRRDRSSGGAA
ncbi:hypothetical protein POI8812_02169 [Pontivivens insulae]|uniref:Uncharacterized protein n=1 Tax=Pontivivens insulae TaxID=1639689 RepID=A0A2R8ACS7_9RHOB|nr:hypothetical protein DFR53_1116 [Pontivivens insulae]SPF29848.1 hypothetical protein POI8812_02169 [Pontivivens insulae]